MEHFRVPNESYSLVHHRILFRTKTFGFNKIAIQKEAGPHQDLVLLEVFI